MNDGIIAIRFLPHFRLAAARGMREPYRRYRYPHTGLAANRRASADVVS
jgi:hypothetical protein